MLSSNIRGYFKYKKNLNPLYIYMLLSVLFPFSTQIDFLECQYTLYIIYRIYPAQHRTRTISTYTKKHSHWHKHKYTKRYGARKRGDWLSQLRARTPAIIFWCMRRRHAAPRRSILYKKTLPSWFVTFSSSYCECRVRVWRVRVIQLTTQKVREL